MEEGTFLQLTLQSFTVLYLNLLAIQLMPRRQWKGTIHTDYVEVVNLTKTPIQLRSMADKIAKLYEEDRQKYK